MSMTMKRITQILSPKSSSGSFLGSLLIHGGIGLALVLVLNARLETKTKTEDYLDLGYQTFDEPPIPAQEVKTVKRSAEPVMPTDTKTTPDNSAKELQDEKGDVAGSQEAKKENSIDSDSNGQAASTPYYKIKPKYPRAALQAGTEGWVLMNIDINEQGEVENIRVVDGEQRNLFQSEARRAVSQWKYKPFTDGSGKVFKKSDHQVRVDFKLTETKEM